MSDRREFLKAASILGFSACSGLSAMNRPDDQRSSGAHGRVRSAVEGASIVLENAEMRLEIGVDGSARSLIHKPTGQECLAQSVIEPMFSVTQYRPYDNELQLAYPGTVTHFQANHVRLAGGRLIVTFEDVGYECSIQFQITDAYIAFRLESLTFIGYTPILHKEKTPIDETLFVQLPLRNRANLGDWLNVMWDEKVAVNLLATDSITRVSAEPRQGYHLFQAGTVKNVCLMGAGAALITTSAESLLDRIARVEEDFELPRGVESRRSKQYKQSYYQALTVTPQDIDRQLRFAKMAGFRQFNVYCLAFANSVGSFPWRPEYPGGIADLKNVVEKIARAGMLPGLHILYTMATETDPYVTPAPDPRLNLLESFTLASSIDGEDTSIPIEENPQACTLDEGKRIIRIGNELISYRGYSSQWPYRFEGCQRGALGTKISSHEKSSRVGLLDMYGGGSPSWLFARFSQNTNIQEEVAGRLQAIYEAAGFRFLYFDGAEQVSMPYWYTVSRAQELLFERLSPKPLFSEGSCKTHFGWHIVSRGNAFDVAKPEQMKAAARAYPGEEVRRIYKDFTSINFGWIGYWPPSENTIGTQPDMLEYVTSRAAAWDCPISLSDGNQDLLSALESHPRTADNLEVIRRWEEVRERSWLTNEQKILLRNYEQEHTLLLDKDAKFVLVPWEPIENLGQSKAYLRAFIFKHEGSYSVAYWNPRGEGSFELPVGKEDVMLFREFGRPIAIEGSRTKVDLPLGERRYLVFPHKDHEGVLDVFSHATVIGSMEKQRTR